MKWILILLFSLNLYSNEIYTKTIDILSNIQYTKYRHYRDGFVISKHRMDIDCSGFVDYIIHSINPSLYAKMLKKSKYSCNRVMAADYVDFFKNNQFKEFKVINNVKDIQKGDIIAYKLHNGVVAKKCKNNKIIFLTKCKRFNHNKCVRRENTGHIFIALSTPKKYQNKWILKVADSTTHLHKNDSRTHSGVGYGYIFLHQKYIQIHKRKIPIYIGRLR